uniref:Sulfur compound chelating protein SoxZ n=1 Tax=Candidatus Kentrum sp. DK TaxID=2126562 RepID=A0A450SYI5_9GAMM|nr:MAG: sulfur compound chelating protein SoxZ [Candidatus Kentron sp. DK]VFJ59075.1 MAG: sulfur compound chelating protein SoxZ [Candidatus Kentron sp. DK]
MASKSIRMKATQTGEETLVIAILKHPMETGTRKNPDTGKPVPAHYITEVLCKHGDALVATISMGPSVSKDPKIRFKFKGGNKGERVSISWTDNKGESASGETRIK